MKLLRFLLPVSTAFVVFFCPQVMSAPLVTPGGHGRPVLDIVFSESGRYFASSSYDKQVKVWDAKNQKVLASLWHDKEVYGVAFSPDGKLLATCADSGMVTIWNWRQGIVKGQARGHARAAGPVVFLENNTLATAGDDGAIRIWEVGDELSLRHTLAAHKKAVLSLAVDSRGKRLISTGFDKKIIFWNLSDFTLADSMATPAPVSSLAVSEHRNSLLAGQFNGDIISIDLSTGKIQFTLKGHQKIVTDIDCAGDGRFLASASFDGTIRYWDLDSKMQKRVYTPQYGLRQLAVAVNPADLNQLVCGGWDLNSREKAEKPDNAVSSALAVINIKKDQVAAYLPCLTSPLLSGAVHPQSGLIAVGSQQTGVHLFKTEHHKMSGYMKINHFDPVYALAFHPTKPLLLHTTVQGEVHIWNVEKQKRTRVVVLKDFLENQGLTAIAVSPDGKLFAVGAMVDKKVFLCDFETGSIKTVLKAKINRNGSLAFNVDGSLLAVLNGSEIELFRTKKSRRFNWHYKTLKPGYEELMAVDFGARKHLIAAVGANGKVGIFNFEKGEHGTELAGWQLAHNGVKLPGRSIQFHPSAPYLMAGSANGHITLFHLLDLEALQEKYYHKDFIISLMFDPQGQNVFAVSGDHSISQLSFPELQKIDQIVPTRQKESF